MADLVSDSVEILVLVVGALLVTLVMWLLGRGKE